MILIDTDRLVLRELTMDDISATREIVCDERTMYAWTRAWSEQENLDGLRKQLKNYKEDGYGRWAVVLKETGKVIGICGLQWCETDKEKVPEIGYSFNRAYWGRGYASEAAVACRKSAFDILKFNEVFSLVKEDNLASMNVAIRNGMLVRGRYVTRYNGMDMPQYIFSARRADA
jgi:RimJ/RimL family protein N-acetyltransferase